MTAVMCERNEQGNSLAPLVDAARGGDERAVEQLYTTVRPRLLRTALALGTHPEDAADLVQETLWSAHRNLGRFDPRRASFEGWLAVILVRRARNRWRGAARARQLREGLKAILPGRWPGEAGVIEARLTLRRLLGRLTARQREIVALYELAGFSAEETAGALGISAAGVRSVARDARRRLAHEAAREHGREESP